LLDIKATWSPWAIDLSAINAAISDTAQACAPRTVVPATGLLLHIAAGPIKVPNGPETDEYYVALAFSDTAALFRFVPKPLADEVATSPPLIPVSPEPVTDTPINATFYASAALANRYVSKLVMQRPLTLSIPNPPPGFPGEIKLTDTGIIAAATDAVVVSGQFVTDQAGAYTLRIALAGDDLRVAKIEVVYLAEDCSGKPLPQFLECTGRNQLRAQLAATAGQGLTQANQGQVIRPFGTGDLLRVELEGRKVDLIGIVQKLSSSATSLAMRTYFAVEK
jgi:hypothetical protein